MNIVLWIIFGGIVGWLASMVAGTDREQGAIANIIVGILGAIIGGFIVQMFGGSDVSGFNLYSFIVALVGAVVLLMIFKSLRRPRSSL